MVYISTIHMAISGERNKALTPWVTIYTQGELEQITYFQWNLESSTKRRPHSFSPGYREDIPYLKTPTQRVCGDSVLDMFPNLQKELCSLAQHRTVGKILAKAG